MVIAVPLLAIAVGLLRLGGGWDDGAITAAFARTLARAGRIALTPASVTVEGMSSVAWLLLLTLPAFVSANVWAIVLWMKLCAGLAFLGSMPLMWKLSERFLGDRTLAWAATLLLAFTITPFKEVLNGMEMDLYLLLTLALVVVLTNVRRPALSLAAAVVFSALMMLTRFEAPFLLCCIYAGLWFSRPARRRIVVTAGSNAIVFMAIELWRHRQFHLWMPNTVYAKRWPPYQPVHHIGPLLLDRAEALSEIPAVLGYAMALALLVLLLTPQRLSLPAKLWHKVREYPAFLVVMTAACVLFSVALGQNWGHTGRMVLGYLPFVAMLIVSVADFAVRRSGLNRSRVLALLVLAQALGWFHLVLPMLRKPDVVPITRYQGEGEVAEHIRALLGENTLNVMIPDVGGASLCCERLDIHDAALLTNPTLSRTGYAGMPAYFHALRPEVVILSAPWSGYSNLYDDPMLATYGVVGDRGFRALVRPDVYARLKSIVGTTTPIRDSEGCENLADSQDFDDAAYTFRHKDCLVLPGPQPPVNRAN